MLTAFATFLALSSEPVSTEAAQLDAKIRYLQASLERAEGPARLWYFGWVSALGAGLTARTVLAVAAPSEGLRLDSRVAIVPLAAGLAVTLVLTPRTLYAGDSLRDAPERTTSERIAKVRLGEALLLRGSQREQLGRSWIPHAAGIALNLGAGAYLGLHDERWTSGILLAAGGIVINELKIFTQPTTATDELIAYRRRFARSNHAWSTNAAPRPESASLTFAVVPFGVVVSGRF